MKLVIVIQNLITKELDGAEKRQGLVYWPQL